MFILDNNQQKLMHVLTKVIIILYQMNFYDMISFQFPIKDIKQKDLWISRANNPIFGTPKIFLGKTRNNHQQILVDNLFKISPATLKELNSNLKAFTYAKNIIFACVHLSHQYGYFMINENMVFSNQKDEIFVWINPNIFENKVKIYVPFSPQGLKSMIKSIIFYLRMWLKFDYKVVETASDFEEVIQKLSIQQQLKINTMNLNLINYRQYFKGRRSEVVNCDKSQQNYQKRPSNFQQSYATRRSQNQNQNINILNQKSNVNLSLKNKHEEQIYLKSLSKTKNTDQQIHKTTLVSQNPQEYDQIDLQFQTKNNKGSQISSPKNEYAIFDSFPNRATAAKRQKLLETIRKIDIRQYEQVKNNIIISQEKFKQTQKSKKKILRQTYDKIDQAFKDMFFSKIQIDKSFGVDELQQDLEQLFNF